MKRLLTFSLPQAVFESKPLEYKEVVGGHEITAMLFSTSYNRNKAYFQVSDLLKWVNKTESILNNLNHDLTLTSGQYFGTKDTKLTKIWHAYTDGELEIWGTLQTKDAKFLSYLPQITAPSIELMVNEENCISGENGEYYTSFDWVSIGWLLGIVAGSGNARITEIKEFNHLSTFNIDQTMTEDQVKALLDEQATSLKAEFKITTDTITDTILVKFQEVLEAIKPVEIPQPEVIVEEPEVITEPIAEPEPTPETIEDTETLNKIENSFKKAELIAQFKNSKQVPNREDDVAKVVKPANYSQFIDNLNL